MVFDNILQLQRQLTDKYVLVDASRPELQRFRGQTGVVKTVNFTGRALVQFDAYNNIGWYDIDPQFLKVIDAPLPAPAAKEPKAQKKAAPIKQDKPAEAKPIGETSPPKPAAAKPTAAKPAGGASVADILAAARGGAKPAAKAEEKPAGKPTSTAEILAAARTKPAEAAAPPAQPAAAPQTTAAEPAKIDPKKLSVADMLAMARGQKPAGGPAPAPAAPAARLAPEPAPLEAEPVVEESPAAEPEAAEEKAPAAAAQPGKVDRTTMDVAAMLAYCRKVDGK